MDATIRGLEKWRTLKRIMSSHGLRQADDEVTSIFELCQFNENTIISVSYQQILSTTFAFIRGNLNRC